MRGLFVPHSNQWANRSDLSPSKLPHLSKSGKAHLGHKLGISWVTRINRRHQRRAADYSFRKASTAFFTGNARSLSLFLWRKSKLLTLRLREKAVERKWEKMVSPLSISEDRFFNVSDKRGVGRVKGRRTAGRYSALRL